MDGVFHTRIQQYDRQDVISFQHRSLFLRSQFDSVLKCADQRSHLNLLRSTSRKAIPSQFVNGGRFQIRVVHTR